MQLMNAHLSTHSELVASVGSVL